MGASVGLFVKADNVNDADLVYRLRDHVHLGANEVFVHDRRAVRQETDLDRSGCGQLGVHQFLHPGPETLRERVELKPSGQ